MENHLKDTYRAKSLWQIYASAVATISIAVVVLAFVIGAYDLLKLSFPSFTLSSALHEKYQTNDSYTEFGLFKKDLSQEAITRERTANYEKLLRMERRNAEQRLVKVGLALLAVAALNGTVVLTSRRRSSMAA